MDHAEGKLLYHELAEAFEELVNRDSDAEASFINEAFSDHGVASGRLLDLGCGVGRILARVATLSPKFAGTGVDLSLDVLRVARVRYSLPTVRGDVRRLPFAASTFACAMCVWTTYNYLSRDADRTAFFDECSRVLERGGLLFIDSAWRPDGFSSSETRAVAGSVWSGELVIGKRVDDGVNVALYQYDIVDRRTGDRHHFVDQEICCMFSVSQIVEAAAERFILEQSWTSYSGGGSEEREICLLRRR
ncbi:MAG: class I SAM-dependent methyltransferase [Chloroflexota bacterium]|nr:class I SAM-dependent methyltransferase [Chloroflexota bacterium]